VFAVLLLAQFPAEPAFGALLRGYLAMQFTLAALVLG
jgi:hypothetical protein